MRTSIEVAKNDSSVTTNDSKNGVKRVQNRIRNQKKTKSVEDLTQNIGSVIKHTNDENIDKNNGNSATNTDNNNTIHRPSIGKWMYESDDCVAIDLRTNQKDSNESDDDVVVIDTIPAAGPSGLSAVPKDKNSDYINDLMKDYDLNPTFVDNSAANLVLEDVMFDMNMEDIERFVTGKIATKRMAIESSVTEDVTETITIDDSPETESTAASSTAAEEVEIIRVKFLNEPNDSDIEVLSEILSPQEVIDVMRVQLKSLQSVTQLSFTTIRLLMTKYEWNKDLFLNHFFDCGIERLLKHNNIVISYELKSNVNKRRRLRRQTSSMSTTSTVSESESSGGAAAAEPQELKTCLVCFDEFNVAEVFAPNCGHSLCIDCWNQYVTAHVSDSSSQEMVTCPGDNCPNIIDDEDLLAIIQEKKTRDKYQRLISNSFVMKNSLLKWCPSGDCLHAVRVRESGFQDVECICKTVFCFLCSDRWHEPLSCEQHQNWIQRYASQMVDKKSAKWLTKHTKCCPRCRFPIEKNGGCNYVLCLKCRHQFCYNCLGRCSHGRCLGQNAEDALRAQANDQWLKDDLSVYPTIKKLYQKQSDRFAVEDKLQKDVSQKLEKAVKCLEFKSALKFLKSGFTVLCHCRQTLMYSYVFGYYLLGPIERKAIYTQNLSLLERQTEYLSMVLTTETAVIQRDAVLDIKRKVQPIYRDCEAKRSQLVLHIREGLAHNYWQFSALSNS